MFLHYLITAWRNLLKNRIVSVINILGLTLGLASAVIAIAYAQYELSYEKIHEKADRIAAIYLKGVLAIFHSCQIPLVPKGKLFRPCFRRWKQEQLQGFIQRLSEPVKTCLLRMTYYLWIPCSLTFLQFLLRMALHPTTRKVLLFQNKLQPAILAGTIP